MIINNCFLNKNFDAGEIEFYRNGIAKIIEEKEDSYLIKFEAFDSFITKWVPKSVIEGCDNKKQQIKTKAGEVLNVVSIIGNFVKTTDGRTFAKFAVEFI